MLSPPLDYFHKAAAVTHRTARCCKAHAGACTLTHTLFTSGRCHTPHRALPQGTRRCICCPAPPRSSKRVACIG